MSDLAERFFARCRLSQTRSACTRAASLFVARYRAGEECSLELEALLQAVDAHERAVQGLAALRHEHAERRDVECES